MVIDQINVDQSRGGFRSTSPLLDLSARVDGAAKPTLRIDKRELSHVSSVTVTFLSPLKDNATQLRLYRSIARAETLGVLHPCS